MTNTTDNEFVAAHKINKTLASRRATTLYDAAHVDGTTWRLAAKNATQATLFARNYCLRHGMLGPVTLTDCTTGEIIHADYSY